MIARRQCAITAGTFGARLTSNPSGPRCAIFSIIRRASTGSSSCHRHTSPHIDTPLDLLPSARRTPVMLGIKENRPVGNYFALSTPDRQFACYTMRGDLSNRAHGESRARDLFRFSMHETAERRRIANSSRSCFAFGESLLQGATRNSCRVQIILRWNCLARQPQSALRSMRFSSVRARRAAAVPPATLPRT